MTTQYHRLPRNLARLTFAVVCVTVPLLSAQRFVDNRNSRREASAAVVKATTDIAHDAARVARSAKRVSAKVCRSSNKNARELNAVLDYFTTGIESQGIDPATSTFLAGIPRPTIEHCPKG